MKSREAALVVSLLLGVSSHAAAQDAMAFTLEEAEPDVVVVQPKHMEVDTSQAIVRALGALRWGMSKADVLKVLKAQIQAQFEQRIKVERDIMRQDALYQRAQDLYRRISGDYIEFDGTKTGWDVSPIAPEFSQRNAEAMLVVRNEDSRDLYFFMRGKLWKWYREFSADTQQAATPEAAFNALVEQFGRGRPQTDRVDASNLTYPGQTWSAGNTRVTALHRDRDTCLILEDTQVSERLAELRHNAQPKDAHARATLTIDWVLLPKPALEARER